MSEIEPAAAQGARDDVVMGAAMVAGWWTQLFAPLVRWFARAGWPPI